MDNNDAKAYKDPVLNKIVQEKAAWNRQVSTFINDIIHFKKSMNGWPSKFYKERTRITQPVPIDLGSIIGKMSSEFQEIANQGNSILQEQATFAKTRNQKKSQQTLDKLEEARGPENAPTPTDAPTPAGPSLTQQLSKGASDRVNDLYLITEASNPLTRFFYRLLSPGIGLSGEAARVRKYRMSLLDSTVVLYKELKKLQSEIVKSGPQSIFIAAKHLDKIEDSYVFLASGLQSFKEVLPTGATDTGGKIAPPDDGEKKTTTPITSTPPISESQPSPAVTQAVEAVRDIAANGNNFKGTVGMPALRTLALQLTQAKTLEEREVAAQNLLPVYQQMLRQLSANKAIPVQDSLAAILAAQTSTPKSAAIEIQLDAQAQNFLGKMRHQISPFDKTSALRLDVYKKANESRKIADKIMDHLETGLEMNTLAPLIKELGANMLTIRTIMHGLQTTIKGQGYQPQFMNLMEKERNVDLDPKQKAQLSKLLEQRQLRDLTKMYSR